MPTIELGELGPGPASDPVRNVDDRSGGSVARPVGHRREVRRVGVAVVLAGSLVLVAAGDPVARPLPGLGVPARLGATVYTVGEWLLVADPLGPGTRSQELAAYRVPGDPGGADGGDLAPRWRTVLPSGEFDAPRLLGSTLVLATQAYRSGTTPGRVLALDLATGALRWARDAHLEAVNVAGQLLLSGTSDPSVAPATPVRAVDPASGQVRWSLPAQPGARRHYPSVGGMASPTVVVVEPSGRVSSRDTGTGALISAIELPPPDESDESDEPRWYGHTAGDLFLVHERGRVTAYGLPRLDRRWSAIVDDDREFGPGQCGSELCSYRRDGGVRFWDAATGETRWTSDLWSGLRRFGDELVGIEPAESGQTAVGLSVVDAATGRALAALGAWQVLDGPTPSSRFVGVRVDPDWRAWIAEIDVSSRRVRLLSVLPGVSGDCASIREWLHCRRVDASVGLWPLPVRRD